MDKNKLISSLFILIGHEKSILIVIRNFLIMILAKLGNSQDIKSLFLNNQETKIKIVDLGALDVLIRVSFVWLSSFYCENLESWWIFRETLKISAKKGSLPISAQHVIFEGETDLGALHTFFANNINFNFLSIVKT